MGQLLLHASGMRHAGNAISRGVRWVLVVFLVSTAVPQLARYSAHIAGGAMLEASEAEDAGDEHAAAAARRRAETALETASPAPSPRPYTSPTSPLYLRHISPTSPLFLPYISPTCPLHVPYISPTSPLYLPSIPWGRAPPPRTRRLCTRASTRTGRARTCRGPSTAGRRPKRGRPGQG